MQLQQCHPKVDKLCHDTHDAAVPVIVRVAFRLTAVQGRYTVLNAA